MAFFNKKKEATNKKEEKSAFEKTIDESLNEDANSYLFRDTPSQDEEEEEYDYEALGIEDDEDEDFIEDEDDLLRRFGKKKKSRNLELEMKKDEELLQEQTYNEWEQHTKSLEAANNDFLADLEYFEKGGVK